MEHILSLEGPDLQRLREMVFPSIADGETILFLGAGASVTDDKMYLSQQVMDLYSAKQRISLDTGNITEYVDTLSADPNFSRNEFDDFVVDLLKRLKVTETHRTIAGLPWKEIITTNYDLLLEQAYDDLVGTTDALYKLIPILKVGRYDYTQANDEIKYVKLNGSISDRHSYPLVFSTRDFNDSKVFYRRVLRSLENLSNRINFLSVGYSYSDPFSRDLLQRFDEFNVRSKRWLLNVDPYAEPARLPFFTENRICVIRTSGKQFFEEYKIWEKQNEANLASRRSITYRNRDNQRISISDKVALRIGGDLLALSDSSYSAPLSPQSFYRGQEPTFDVARKQLDVVKIQLLQRIKDAVQEILASRQTLVPILFLTGSYGTGKTTLCYRVIDELNHDPEAEVLAFEVADATKLNPPDLGELFSQSRAKTIVLFFNGIEVDSAFKTLMNFRADLSVEQFHDVNILILASIRENILAKYKLSNPLPTVTEIDVDEPFDNSEASDLIEKLNAAGILKYRDVAERNKLAKAVVDDFSGDTLIALISLVSNSHHSYIIRNAYEQLSKKAQEALIYTSLLHRFNLLMPSTLLRTLISKTWEEFTKDVLQYDSKGIMLQEERKGVGTSPDIYLRTKHPIIADELVKLYLPSEDKKFERYKQVLQRVNPSKQESNLVINLLKAIRRANDLSGEKVSKLFDICSQIFDTDPHFNLHYAIDLQYRNDRASLEKAIERVGYAESFLDHRNHRLTHRRAVLNFQLARDVLREEVEPNEVYRFMAEAKNLFEIKLILDPFSSFSYVDYLKFEIWVLENFVLDDIETLRQRVVIEELLDKAERSVFEGAQLITEQRAQYLRMDARRSARGSQEYLDFLDRIYEDADKRPFALILKYYHLGCSTEDPDCSVIVDELEAYSYLDEVAKVLFRDYGRHLYNANDRVKFFEILRKHPDIQEKDPVRYHYYSYVAEAYNRNFGTAYDHLGSLRRKVHRLNPELNETWKDGETFENKEFEGIVTSAGRRKRIKVIDLQRPFDLKAGDYSAIPADSKQLVRLHFYLSGIRAEIVPLK